MLAVIFLARRYPARIPAKAPKGECFGEHGERNHLPFEYAAQRDGASFASRSSPPPQPARVVSARLPLPRPRQQPGMLVHPVKVGIDGLHKAEVGLTMKRKLCAAAMLAKISVRHSAVGGMSCQSIQMSRLISSRP